jgi:hypothetical protein
MKLKSVILLLEDEADFDGTMYGENRYIIVDDQGNDVTGMHYSWEEAEKLRKELEEELK